MKEQLNNNYNLILQKEQKFSKSVAFESLEKPQITVWIIIAPLYLIYYMHRARKYKQGIETFAENFLMSKKWALEGAYEMVDMGVSLQAMMKKYEEQAHRFGNTEELCRLQAREINLLLKHYHGMLNAQGETYADLLRNAYGTRQRYEDFIKELQEAEKAISQTAINSMEDIDTESAFNIASAMHEATHRLRFKEAGEIFG